MHHKEKPKTEKQAKFRAQELARHLNKVFNTDQWTVEVWWNTEWCYSVHCGTISVSYFEITGKFFTLISEDHQYKGTGSMLWHNENNHELPEESVRLAVKAMTDKMNSIKSIVEENLKLLNIKNNEQ